MTSENPFATLGVEPRYDVNLRALESVYRELARALHPDRYVGAPPTERRTSLAKAVLVNEAWRTVSDPVRRAEALFAVRGVKVGDGHEPKASPEFLMDAMEQREALSNAAETRDMDAIRALAAGAERELQGCLDRLSRGFKDAKSAAELAPVASLLGEIRFHKRLLEETEALLEAATEASHDTL